MMPQTSRNPKKKNKSAAHRQNRSHGSVGESSQQLGSQNAERVAPIGRNASIETEMTPSEIYEVADVLEIQVISSRILEKLQQTDSRRSDHPLPERLKPMLSSIREQAVANLSAIFQFLEDEQNGESTESSEKLAPDLTTPKKEDPPPLHFHIYASALLPEPYVAQGWHYVPVLQHQAPTPAGGNQFVPVQQHGQPTPAAGYQSVPAQQYARPIRYMPMPYVPYPPRPGYLPYNQQTESSQPQHGNDEWQQASQADNPSQNNSLQDGVPEDKFGAQQRTLGTQTTEAQEEKSAERAQTAEIQEEKPAAH